MIPLNTIICGEWHNCYEGGWQGIIVPEAFSHPAKMSYGLLKRILSHAKEQGWLKEGDVILDPFGGIGSTGILGAYEGYQVVCVELEAKFCKLAEKNFELHKDAWVEFGNPHPVMIQGDSRRLCEIVEKADLIVSSPPFFNTGTGITKEAHNRQVLTKSLGTIDIRPYLPKSKCVGDYLKESRKIKGLSTKDVAKYFLSQSGGITGCVWNWENGVNMPTIPQWKKLKQLLNLDDRFDYGMMTKIEQKSKVKYSTHKKNAQLGTMIYGQTPGQLGSMKPGSVDAVVSSPPYAETLKGDGTQSETAAESRAKRRTPGGSLGQSQRTQGYGSKGNLGNLKSGNVDCVISSPPYEKAHAPNTSDSDVLNTDRKDLRKWAWNQTQQGKTPGQLGNDKGDTFWSAAKIIVQQCYQILKPGGQAIWVVKSFVRKKKIVDFPGDWQRLCEAAGFQTVCIHHAMLVKETKHKTLFGHTEVKRKERKSFFRRLAESKGSPRIDYEVVLCMQRPAGLI